MPALKFAVGLLAIAGALVVGTRVGAGSGGNTPASAPRPVTTILQPSGPLGPDGPLGPSGPLHGGGCIGPNVNPTSLGPDGPLGPNGPLGPGGAAANRACKAAAPSNHAKASAKHGKASQPVHRKRARRAAAKSKHC